MYGAFECTICSWILILYCTNIGSSFAKECSEDYNFDLKKAESGSNGAVVRAESSSEEIAIKYSCTVWEREIMEDVAKKTNGNGVDTDDCTKAIRAEQCNFVKFLGTCDMNHREAIKLEYLSEVLGDVMYLQHFATPDLLIYAFQLLQAVETLQRIKIVHGDIKPYNVGFNADGALKIFDFGNSYPMDDLPYEMTYAPDYASPESLLFEENLDPSQSDTWSVGVIIYELFTGKERFIDVQTYETCESRCPGVTWKHNSGSVCSGRAYYHAARLHRCSGEDSECAGVYREIEEKLERRCKPTVECISKLKKSLEEFDEIFEPLVNDEEGRIEQAGATANKADLITIVKGLLCFDYTKRMKPHRAKFHSIFLVMLSSNI